MMSLVLNNRALVSIQGGSSTGSGIHQFIFPKCFKHHLLWNYKPFVTEFHWIYMIEEQ